MAADNNLILPSILPGELDRGYLGRIMQANGIAAAPQMVSRLARWAGMGELTRRMAPTALLLGKVAYGDSASFVQWHTMSPLRRAITSYLPDQEHGCETSVTMLWSSGMRTARPGAYFCPDCVSEDEAFHGFSYWRREHQIPGLFWCPKHATVLRYREEPNAFFVLPSALMKACHIPSENWVREAMANVAVNRYLAISSFLIERRVPISVRQIQPILRYKAAEHGLQTHGNKVNAPLLSDAVVGAFGREWLATVLPVAADKKERELLNQVDGVLFLPSSASSVPAYILAMALLYDSPEEAMNAILAPTPLSAPRRRRSPSRPFNRAELRRAYCAARGNHSAAVKSLSTNSPSMRIHLQQMGMPNLAPRNRSLEVAVRSFFVDGISLAEAASLGRTTSDQMESVLRIAGAGFVEMLMEMDHPLTGPGSGTRRRLKLTPREVESAEGRTVVKFSSRVYR